MDATTRAMLNDAEQELLRETTKAKLAKLDEDALIDLHTRIRRARTKYVTMHRRRGAKQVQKDRSRVRSSRAITPTAVKAEVFEEALGKVSEQLAKVAADAAETLKQERLAAAAAVKGAPQGKQRPSGSKASKKASTRSRSQTPIDKKRAASTRSATGRSQARRDAKR